MVENQVGKKDLAINDCDSKQSVYVYGCKDAVLQVNGNVYDYIYFAFLCKLLVNCQYIKNILQVK